MKIFDHITNYIYITKIKTEQIRYGILSRHEDVFGKTYQLLNVWDSIAPLSLKTLEIDCKPVITKNTAEF